MTWALLGLFVGLTAVVTASIPRDIRRATERRAVRVRRAQRRAEIARVTVAAQGFATSLRALAPAAARATDALGPFAEALAVRTGRRGPFKPHPIQKGRPTR